MMLAAAALLAIQPPLSVALAAQTSAPGCAAMPTLALEPGFVDPRRIFGPESPGMRATRAEFEIAYRRACRENIVRGLFDHVPGNVLMLRNSPHANVASIFSVSINRRRGAEGLVLEYPFVTDEGVLQVPRESEIHEAIYCRAVGATALEQEQEGRCLPD